MAKPDRIVRMYLRDRFVVTTKSGQTWRGLLIDIDDNTLLLADCDALSPDGTATHADGQVYIPRPDVAYMQRS